MESSLKIALLNGPNLNLLGVREPGVYGSFTLKDVEKRLSDIIDKSGLDIHFEAYQSNVEGELINFIHKCFEKSFDYIIFNPGAYTHTSIALRDAVSGTNMKVVEVHISNIHKRESFRHNSFIAGVSIGQISGFGIDSYVLALKYILGLHNE